MAEDMDLDALERELAQLGPVMLRQEQAEAEEPDELFLQSLRARLAGEESAQPDEESTQERALPEPIPIERARQRHRWLWGGGLAASAVAAAAIAIVATRGSSNSPQAQHAAFALPTPNATQLAQTYPPLGGLGGGGGNPPPWVNLLQIPSGGPYPGHLKLSAPTFPRVASSATAYRLKGSSFDAPRLAQLAATLGVPGTVKHSTQPDGHWTYVWKMTTGAQGVDQSVAVNLRNGELLYHDLSALPDLRGLPLNDPRNVAAAQAWLERLGWPGSAMQAHYPVSKAERDMTDTVTLGWVGAGPVDVPAAILVVNKNGRVVDAQLWPPVAQSGSVPTRSVATAWKDVESGKAPVAVIQKQIGEPFNNGTGTLQGTGIIDVFTQTPSGALYLAPAYRFEGQATIQHLGVRHWLALAPATGR